MNAPVALVSKGLTSVGDGSSNTVAVCSGWGFPKGTPATKNPNDNNKKVSPKAVNVFTCCSSRRPTKPDFLRNRGDCPISDSPIMIRAAIAENAMPHNVHPGKPMPLIISVIMMVC